MTFILSTDGWIDWTWVDADAIIIRDGQLEDFCASVSVHVYAGLA